MCVRTIILCLNRTHDLYFLQINLNCLEKKKGQVTQTSKRTAIYKKNIETKKSKITYGKRDEGVHDKKKKKKTKQNHFIQTNFWINLILQPLIKYYIA